MCKILVAVKTSDKENKQFRQAIEAQESDLFAERDGMGAIIIDNIGQMSVFRSHNNYREVLNKVYAKLKNAKLVSIHTRTGTSGETGLTNVHFFEAQNLLMAHNGFVSKYHSYSNTNWDYGMDVYGRGYNHSSPGKTSKPKQETFFQTAQKAGSALQQEQTLLKAKLGFDNDQKLIGESIEIDADTNPYQELSEELEELEEIMEACRGCISSKAGYCKKHKAEGYRHANILESMGYTKDGNAKETKETKTNASPYCDSFEFIRNIKTPLTKESLADEMEKKEFTGMSLLLDKENAKQYLMIRRKEALAQVSKDFSIFYSYQPTTEYSVTKYDSIYGVSIIKQKEDVQIQLPTYKVIEGVHEISLTK
jgi:predicted glutamine amidotransferase/dsDNA-binding SOS-regulon protein